MRFKLLRSRVLAVSLTVVFAAIFFGNVGAQSGTSSINGTVTDLAGAAVPGATVTIRNPATSFSRSATTDNVGNYRFPGIPPATYVVEVEASNFKRAVNNNVQALVDMTLSLNIVMQIGAVTATVDVTAKPIESVVNKEDASIGNNFVPEQITQLPSNLRQVNDLLSLQPGVTREGYVAGGRSDQANITLDGVDINDQQTGGRTFFWWQTTQDSALRVTTESVEEFRITIANANANQGRSSGAQISLVTRGGGNDLHGSGFYFIRPTAFSANNFFNNLAGVERPSLNRDVFGGRIGGPVWKNRLFFFYSYEGQRQNSEESVVRGVPLAHMGNGEMRFGGTGPTCVDGTCTLNTDTFNVIFDQVLQNPLAVAVYADAATRYPANEPGGGINTRGFRFNAPITIRENTHIARFDYNISDAQQVFLRANYQWDNSTQTSNFPDTPAPLVWSHPTGFAVGHNWVISGNKINNFRFGFTRQAFNRQGDSGDPRITLGVFSPKFFQRTLSRVTTLTNITDDFTWIKGNHTIQFGANIRVIRNQRSDFADAYDSAGINPLVTSGVIDAIENAGYTIAAGQTIAVRIAATALIGRFTQYTGNYTYDIDGSVLPAGTASDRIFATEEYDVYGQDIWRPFRGLTITGGLRYALTRPVYEKNGFQVVPSERLGDFFERRAASAANGVPLNDPIQFQLAGPANKAPGFYSMDWNNFQPRIAAAWSPSFKHGFWKTLFGDEGESAIRGGFAVTNDHYGGQLAVSFDKLSTIGFTSSTTIPAFTYNVTDRPAPLFTGFGQDIRTFPGIPAPAQRFMTPADEALREEVSLDATIISPIHYQWNVSYGRSLPAGMYFEAGYIGRRARNLFATRDIMAFNNLVDPQSGIDWYTAAGMLVDARRAGVPITGLPPIPYFENLFPNAMAALGVFGLPANNNTQAIYGLFADDGFAIRDYTFIQLIIDDATGFGLPVNPGIFPNMFIHPQYASFSAFGTTAYSDYHGGLFSLRQRLGNTLSYDINYTYSKSMDNASGLQTGGAFGSQFIWNSLRPDDNRSVSDFDTRHVVNANFIFQLPIGEGRTFFTDMNQALDAVFGGWQLAGVYRWNSGGPITAFDRALYATNWSVPSNSVRTGPIPLANGGADRTTLNIFSDPQTAFNNFRNARPGETGDRNVFRIPGYQALDLGLSKSFAMPWNGDHRFQFRWEVFNVTNVQYFFPGAWGRLSLPANPETGIAPANFGKIYNGIQGSPRSMQFGFRYEF